MISTITYGLRDYQETLVKGIFEAWTHNPRVMVQLPTGGGKTIVFSAIASEFIKRGENVLILAHREELQPPLKIWEQYAQLRGYKSGWARFRFEDQEKKAKFFGTGLSPF